MVIDIAKAVFDDAFNAFGSSEAQRADAVASCSRRDARFRVTP